MDTKVDEKAQNITQASVPVIPQPIERFAVGGTHGFCIRKSGLYCWGANHRGQLGLGNTRPQPHPVKHPLTDVLSIYCLYESTFAITRDGLYCWGDNSRGQLGLGHYHPQFTPLKSPLENVISITHGDQHVYALCSDGYYCWGMNQYGQLGLGATGSQNTPQKFKLEGVISIHCGSFHTFAITTNGLYGWGYNGECQLGLGSQSRQICSPQSVGLNKVSWIACGPFHTFAQTEKGIVAWGSNKCGELSLPAAPNVATPQPVTFKGVVESIWCGSFKTFVKTTSGLYCWGHPFVGEPSQIELDRVLAMSCFCQSALALTPRGLYAWGDNAEGQLGLGHKKEQPTPHPLPFDDVILPTPTDHSLKGLLHSKACCDMVVGGFEVHKAVFGIRCPEFLDYDYDKTPVSTLKPFIEFVYCNTVDKTPELPVLYDLIRFSKDIKMKELTDMCRILLAETLNYNNAFDCFVYAVQNNLEDEIDSVSWFIAHNKIPIPTEHERLNELFQNHPNSLNIFSTLWRHAISKQEEPLVPPLRLRSIEDDMELLFDTGNHFDYALKFGGVIFQLHSFVLSRWKFFDALRKHSDEHNPGNGLPVETFRKLLRFFYCSKVETLTMADAAWILSMKEYYMLEPTCPLIEYCGRLTEITNLNWIEGYKLGLELNQPSLIDEASQFAQKLGPHISQAIIQLCLANHEKGKIIEEKEKEIQKLRGRTEKTK